MSAAVKLASAYEVLADTADRDAWLEARTMGLGASEIAQVLGESPWGSPLSLYAQKIGSYERDLSEVEAVYWGNKLEAPILEAYEERTGRRTRREGKLLRSVEHPWALCTLDGSTWEAANDSGAWPLEVKNTTVFKASEWEFGAPPHYYLQCQQQLLVTGAEKATIAALIGGQRMVWADIPRDETAIRRIVYHGSRFWERVQRRDMPVPDGTEASRRALAALYPQGSGIVVLSHAAIEAADRLESLKAELRALEAEKEAIENSVRADIGEAETGVMTDGRSFSWKTQSRKECVIKASTFRVLRLHHAKGRR